MAALDKQFRLRGKVGPSTYRVYRSKTVVQSRPGRGKMKQTQATKVCSSEFAVASNTARVIRMALLPVYQRLNDGAMVNRFTSAVLAAMRGNKEKERGVCDLYNGDLSCLENFQFNINSPLYDNLLVRPTAELNEDRLLTVRVPEFDLKKELKKPYWSTDYTIRIVAAAFNLKKEYYQFCGHHDIEISSRKEHQEAVEWVCSEPIPNEAILLVTVSLHYYQYETIMGKVTQNTKQLQSGL